jgi:HSP20 family protein
MGPFSKVLVGQALAFWARQSARSLLLQASSESGVTRAAGASPDETRVRNPFIVAREPERSFAMLPALTNGSGLSTVRHPVNRLIDQFLNDEFFAPASTAGWRGMPLSAWQDENNVYVEVDAPGLTESDLDVSVHEGMLTIRGERKCERKAEGYDTRAYGRFEQQISLPTPVDADRVEAKLANGVLSLTFPKSEAAKPRKIAIQTR